MSDRPRYPAHVVEPWNASAEEREAHRDIHQWQRELEQQELDRLTLAEKPPSEEQAMRVAKRIRQDRNLWLASWTVTGLAWCQWAREEGL